MTEFKITAPFGHTLFCDDIRLEVGGKFSFMGVVSGTMFMNVNLPVALPKFCIFVQYYEQHGTDIPPLKLQIFLPENDDKTPAIEMPVPVPTVHPPVDEMFGDTPFVGFGVPVNLAPFNVMNEGTIRVRMLRGDDTVRLGRLVIRQAPILFAPANQDTQPPV